MPLIRIDLVKEKSRQYRAQPGDIVYRTLVDVLDVPRGDHFQVIQEHKKGDIPSDRDYCWLQWKAATECNITLPLAAFPMHYYPAGRCNPILPFNSKRSRLPNPAVCSGMTTPVGADRQ